MDEKLLETLVSSMEAQAAILKELRTKAPATVQTATPLHGSGGIFSTSGLERDVITAHVRPYGIGSLLPLLPSTSEDPRFGSLTGYTDTVGAEPASACDDAPAGFVKGCNLTARFGLIRRDTQTIEFDKVMRKVNRGDFTDLILRGQVLGLSGLTPSGLDQSKILNILTMSEMVGAAVQAERQLVRQMWQGVLTVANEFPGLDVQIATGQRDADSGAYCTALDSDVKDFNYRALDETIVTYMSTLEWYLKNNAMTMGLEPVQWVWVMRPDLWYELTAMWPCAYNTVRCSPHVDTNSTVFVDGRENVTERDAMRNGMYIDVNGTRYRVVTDTGIFEKNNINTAGLLPGEYASTIYFVPLTITGGFPVTYREYIDYRQGQPDVDLLRGMESFFWTDNGVYSWALEQIKWCYKWALKTEQRVILRTPQLAGRIDNVKYSPLQHLRESDPDSPYHRDGGVSLRDGIGLPFAPWSTRR
jgi:hypothetical protein